jgi:hypothetical protein
METRGRSLWNWGASSMDVVYTFGTVESGGGFAGHALEGNWRVRGKITTGSLVAMGK